MSAPLPMALTAYGLPHVMGYLPTRAGDPHLSPLSPLGLLDAAVELGLAGVEIPLDRASTPPPEALRDELSARSLRIVPDFMVLDAARAPAFADFLEASAALGATVVRALISPLLCGDRRACPGGWEGCLAEVARLLKEALPRAADLGLTIAMENHQDATSDDLLRLFEMIGHHPAYGVCLDTGNPLAVGEGPVEFARRVGPLLRHLHLKDYTIHFAPDGYRLVRCAAGDGVVDFPEILAVARGNGFADLLPGIEIAAEPTRTIPLLDDGWWACYPESQPRYLVEALRVLWAHGLPADEPYGSAWEQGADSAAVSAEEWAVLRQSVAYFRGL